MTKVLFFTGVPVDDAASLYRSGLVAKKLTDRGNQVVFTSVAGNFKGQKTRKVAGLPVTFLGQAHYFAKKPFSKRKRLGLVRVLIENFKTCFRFAKILKKEEPDRVLIVTSMPVSLMAGLTARILGFKIFLDIEDLVVGQMESSGYSEVLVRIYAFLEKAWLKIFNRVAVCSHYLAKHYPGSVILPNMIDVGFWKNKPASGRTRYRSVVKIVFVGQMGSYHGQEEVLDVLTPILEKNNQAKLIFVGAGEKLDHLKQKVKRKKLTDAVSFTGQVSQERVRKIISQSDIGLLPLLPIPVNQARHPLKLLEYLAAGLVVISNDVGETSRLIKNGLNGLLCPPGEVNRLADKVRLVLEDPGLRKRIGRKAVSLVDGFDVKKIVPKWIKFLEI